MGLYNPQQGECPEINWQWVCLVNLQNHIMWPSSSPCGPGKLLLFLPSHYVLASAGGKMTTMETAAMVNITKPLVEWCSWWSSWTRSVSQWCLQNGGLGHGLQGVCEQRSWS